MSMMTTGTRYRVIYGFSGTPLGDHAFDWTGEETYNRADKSSALRSIDYFRKNRPTDGYNPANFLRLEFLGSDNTVLTVIESHGYAGTEPLALKDRTVKHDQVHKEIGKFRPIGPIPQGTYIVCAEDALTKKTTILGAARTAEGAKKLMDSHFALIEQGFTVRAQYQVFFEEEKGKK